MQKVREKITFTLVVLVYLFSSFRYFPGRMADSVLETLEHILKTAPYTVGLTLIAVTAFQKIVGARLSWSQVLRFFFTIGIVFEFFFGLYHYLDKAR